MGRSEELRANFNSVLSRYSRAIPVMNTLVLGALMTRKRLLREDILGLLRQIEVNLANGSTVHIAVRTREADLSEHAY